MQISFMAKYFIHNLRHRFRTSGKMALRRIVTGFRGDRRLRELLQIVAPKIACKGLSPYGCPIIGIMPGRVKRIRGFSYSLALPISCPLA